MYMYNLVY